MSQARRTKADEAIDRLLADDASGLYEELFREVARRANQRSQEAGREAVVADYRSACILVSRHAAGRAVARPEPAGEAEEEAEEELEEAAEEELEEAAEGELEEEAEEELEEEAEGELEEEFEEEAEGELEEEPEEEPATAEAEEQPAASRPSGRPGAAGPKLSELRSVRGDLWVGPCPGPIAPAANGRFPQFVFACRLLTSGGEQAFGVVPGEFPGRLGLGISLYLGPKDLDGLVAEVLTEIRKARGLASAGFEPLLGGVQRPEASLRPGEGGSLWLDLRVLPRPAKDHGATFREHGELRGPSSERIRLERQVAGSEQQPWDRLEVRGTDAVAFWQVDPEEGAGPSPFRWSVRDTTSPAERDPSTDLAKGWRLLASAASPERLLVRASGHQVTGVVQVHGVTGKPGSRERYAQTPSFLVLYQKP